MKTKKRQKEWYEANKLYLAEASRARYKDNREVILKRRAEKRANETVEVREKRLDYLREYRSRVENKSKANMKQQSDSYKYKQYASAAEKRGYGFDLSFNYFCELFHSACDYCGVIDARGIDRIDNSKGYTIDNSAPCCEVCNKMKWAFRKDDFINQARRIAQFNTIISAPCTQGAGYGNLPTN